MITTGTTSYKFSKAEYVLTSEGWTEISPWSYLAGGLSDFQVRITKATITSSDLQKAMLNLQLNIKGIAMSKLDEEAK